MPWDTDLLLLWRVDRQRGRMTRVLSAAPPCKVGRKARIWAGGIVTSNVTVLEVACTRRPPKSQLASAVFVIVPIVSAFPL